MEEKFGARWWSLHRVDLHGEILRLATTSSTPGTPAVIRLGSEVTSLDHDNGVLTIKDGTQFKKDLIILADGSRCQFVDQIVQRPIKMYKTGLTAYRSLVPFSKINADPLTKVLWENEDPGFFNVEYPDTGVKVVTYPCRNNTVLNFAVIHKDEESNSDLQGVEGDNWHNTASQTDVRKCLEGGHPAWMKLCDMTDEIKAFTIMTHEPLDCMVCGRAVLIGDSAHPMLPTHGQGAAQAIEDAAAMEIIFKGQGSGEVEGLLNIYEDVRLSRGAITQIMSNEWECSRCEMEEKCTVFDKNVVLPPEGTGVFSKGIWEFFYPGDAHEDAKKAMKKAGKVN
jgi:salicylate hydroxylase